MPPIDEEENRPTLLGARVRALRKARGLSQNHLAKLLDIKQPSLSDIETGETREISGKVLAGLCRHLRAMPDFFMSDGEADSAFGDLILAQQEATFLIGSMSKDAREAAIGSLRGIAGTATSANNPYGGKTPTEQPESAPKPFKYEKKAQSPAPKSKAKKEA